MRNFFFLFIRYYRSETTFWVSEFTQWILHQFIKLNFYTTPRLGITISINCVDGTFSEQFSGFIWHLHKRVICIDSFERLLKDYFLNYRQIILKQAFPFYNVTIILRCLKWSPSHWTEEKFIEKSLFTGFRTEIFKTV